MVDLRKSGVRFFIPAPVISELSRDEAGDKVARTALEHLGGIRVEGFGLRAARIAGEMLRSALKSRPREMSRIAMKYDAMIAAVAHAARARFMVTANPKDYEKYLAIVNSPVRVLAPDQIESEGQLGWCFPWLNPSRRAAKRARLVYFDAADHRRRVAQPQVATHDEEELYGACCATNRLSRLNFVR